MVKAELRSVCFVNISICNNCLTPRIRRGQGSTSFICVFNLYSNLEFKYFRGDDASLLIVNWLYGQFLTVCPFASHLTFAAINDITLIFIHYGVCPPKSARSCGA